MTLKEFNAFALLGAGLAICTAYAVTVTPTIVTVPPGSYFVTCQPARTNASRIEIFDASGNFLGNLTNGAGVISAAPQTEIAAMEFDHDGNVSERTGFIRLPFS